ncbi:MAG: HDOD domain-containing protein [Epsilonproteobacteria bacterium]|nr:HDOD domain-containing protein [Campylobacterota bacterium]
MITKEDIEKYIQKIPPAPKAVQKTIQAINQGDLIKAAKEAKEDLAFSAYLKELVNKPIYGFRTEVKDTGQIFGILGLSQSQQVVYNYLLNILSPDEWKFFKLNKKTFNDLQDHLSLSWNKILEHLSIKDKEIESSITLLPASIIVCEALFNEKKEEVELIRSAKDLDLNTILKRLSGYTLFDISAMIAKKWEMDPKIIAIVRASSGIEKVENQEIENLAKWMHLLLFYTLSQPQYIEAGLNDFIEFKVEFVDDIYVEFMEVIEIGANE